jgi:hypothetical protein
VLYTGDRQGRVVGAAASVTGGSVLRGDVAAGPQGEQLHQLGGQLHRVRTPAAAQHLADGTRTHHVGGGQGSHWGKHVMTKYLSKIQNTASFRYSALQLY